MTMRKCSYKKYDICKSSKACKDCQVYRMHSDLGRCSVCRNPWDDCKCEVIPSDHW